MGNICKGEEKPAEVIEVTTAKENQDQKETAQEPEPQPQEAEPKLLITIVGAQGLRNSDWMPGTGGKPDCFCELKSGGELLHTTAVLTDVLEPVWREECVVAEIADGAALEFGVYDKDFVGSDFLGKAVLEAKDYAAEGFNGELKLADPKAPQAYIRVKVKVAGKELPPGPPPEFTVTAEKPTKDGSYGLALDYQDGKTLHVYGVKEGVFSAYNASVKPSMQVKVDDYIVSVNGEADVSANMLQQFRDQQKVECVVRRSIKTTILFARGDAGSPLGLEFPEKPQDSYLVVKAIAAEGAAAASNANAKEQDKLLAGDRIAAVGGKKGNSAEMKALLEKASGKVQLNIVRQAIVPKSDEGGGDGLQGLVHWLFG